MVGRRGKVALEEVELEVKARVTQIEEILDIVIDQIEVKEGLGVVLDVLALKKEAEVTGVTQVAVAVGAVMANLVLTRAAEAIEVIQVAAAGLVIVRIVAINVEVMLRKDLLISLSLQKKYL